MAYLKGRYYWNKYTGEGVHKAMGYFTEAIAKDSSHALAYAGLADAYIQSAVDGYAPPDQVMPQARTAIMKALAIDDSLAEAHLSRGVYLMWYEYNWQEAETEFRMAIELNPNSADAHHFYGHYLQSQGRVEEAVVETRKALDLDPLSLIINNELGWALYFTRRYDESVAQYKKTLDMDPEFVFAVWSLAMPYEQEGRADRAIGEMMKFRKTSENWVAFLAEFGYAYARVGDRAKALDIVRRLQERGRHEFVDPAFVANIYIALGDKDRAFLWLDKAYAIRSCVWMPWLMVEPKFDRIRSDPRFAALVKKLHLVGRQGS